MSTLEAFGRWHVTTEGDCEGGSARDLGVHEGYLDQIAFELGDQASYGLTFDAPGPEHVRRPSLCDQVNVSLGSRLQLPAMNDLGRADFLRTLLASRPVVVEANVGFGTVRLRRTITPKMRAEAEESERQFRREVALAKLTAEERNVLGLS